MSEPRPSSRLFRCSALAPIAAALLAAAGVAHDALSQPPSTPSRTPVRRGRVVKQPIVDLAEQAAARRPGQVLPGDPPPEKFAAPIASPAPASPSTEPSSAPAALTIPDSPKPKPAPVPIDPDSGPRAVQPAATPAAPSEPKPETPVAPETKPATPETPAQPEQPKLNVLRGPRDATNATAPGEAASFVLTAVNGVPAGLQWRQMSGDGTDWQTPAQGDRATGRYELRTGVQTEALLTVDDAVVVQIGRLSRVTVERSAQSSAPTIIVARGRVEVLPAPNLGETTAIVRSPDRVKPIEAQPGLRVSYGAFRGTQIERVQVTGMGGF